MARARMGARTAAVLAAGVLLAGCSADPQPAPAVQPLVPRWQPIELPVPDGQRPAPRDSVYCGDRWYLVGALVGPNGATRPAVWSSPNATDWTALTLQPLSFYGEQNILSAIGCDTTRPGPGNLALIGAKTGGAHGNPRVSTWFRRPDGSLLEVVDSLEQYGGHEGVNAARMVGGPLGWLIVGNRTTGAAAWLSPDATRFQRYDNRPNLANDAGTRTTATDGVAVDGGWLMVGGVLRTDRLGRDPAVWTSPDGKDWVRREVPAEPADEFFLRVAKVDGGLVAAGVHGDRFGVWRERGGVWRPSGRFGDVRGSVAASVDGIATVAGRVVVATQAAAGHLLWAGAAVSARPGGEMERENGAGNDSGTVSGESVQGWRPVRLPVSVPAGGTTAATIVGLGDTLLLGVDDGREGTVWLAKITD